MSKFNVRDNWRTAATGPVRTESTASGATYEGAPGYARADAKSELFLLAVSNMVGEQTFYEKADARDARYEHLIREVAVADAGWTLAFLRWLRGDANMRSASLVGAAEAVKARLDAANGGEVGGGARNRQLVDAVLQRADEPGEFLAYWTSRYGRAVPKPVKRGIGDAVGRLYSERALLKYDTGSKGFRFADVLDLVHPSPVAPWQGGLFRYALDRRHGHADEIPEQLAVLTANARLRAAAADDPAALLDADALRAAGMTWEDALSLVGSKVDRARLWSALIPSMGLMALARNLRNFDQAGVPDSLAATVAARFADPEQVAKSRMFPFRWLAAYRHAPSLRWGHALDQALTASLSSVPPLSGRTLILVDVSGSMRSPNGGTLSDMTRADAAGVFGAALAMRAQEPTLVWFDHRSGQVPVPRGGSLLTLVEAIPRMNGGTSTAEAVTRWYQRHDRVVVVTDEQAHYSGQHRVDAAVPERVPFYTWNLGGYRYGHAPGTAHRHTFGGLSDQAFRLIPLLEAGRNGTWPWEMSPGGGGTR